MGIQHYEIPVLIRSNIITMTSPQSVNAFTVIGNKIRITASNYMAFRSYYSGITIPTSKGMIFAFNYLQTPSTPILTCFSNVVDTLKEMGFSIVQNVFESNSSSQPVLSVASDASTSDSVNNAFIVHNTIAGQRANVAYNDHNLNEGAPLMRRDWCVKNNIFDQYNVITDRHAHGGAPDAVRVGNWSVAWGTNCSGNMVCDTNKIGGSSIGDYLGVNYVWAGYGIMTNPKWVSNKSYTGAGGHNGDYHLTETSPAVGLSTEWVLPYDLDGNLRYSGGASGAYEYGTPPQSTKPKSLILDIQNAIRGILRGIRRGVWR